MKYIKYIKIEIYKICKIIFAKERTECTLFSVLFTIDLDNALVKLS